MLFSKMLKSELQHCFQETGEFFSSQISRNAAEEHKAVWEWRREDYRAGAELPHARYSRCKLTARLIINYCTATNINTHTHTLTTLSESNHTLIRSPIALKTSDVWWNSNICIVKDDPYRNSTIYHCIPRQLN